MISRRGLLSGIAGGALVSALPTTAPRAATIGDDGLHKQPWFIDSFLDMTDDLATAADNGKRFAVMIEQRGCPYCREMHEVNLEIEQISSYVSENFDVLQLDMWGSREVTDFDGEAMEERSIIQRWQVNFTPTIVFFPADPAEAEGKTGRQAEVARMPGYFKPFHFLSMFEFVREELYKELTFQRYLQDKFARYQAEGKDPQVW
eukprot:m.266554 g.266554  ORF g.266554 m.266554 type:complete len:204 (-) comp66484_c0_seq1:61-672(-)